jgi:hypothetical protein
MHAKRSLSLLCATLLVACGGGESAVQVATTPTQESRPVTNITASAEGPLDSSIIPAPWLEQLQTFPEIQTVRLAFGTFSPGGAEQVLLYTASTVTLCNVADERCSRVGNNLGDHFVAHEDKVLRVSPNLEATTCTVQGGSLTCEPIAGETAVIRTGEDRAIVGGIDGSHLCVRDETGLDCQPLFRGNTRALMVNGRGDTARFAYMSAKDNLRRVHECSTTLTSDKMSCSNRGEITLEPGDDRETLAQGALNTVTFAAISSSSTLFCSIEDAVYCNRVEFGTSKANVELRVHARAGKMPGDRISVLDDDQAKTQKTGKIDFIAGPLSKTGGTVQPMTCNTFFYGWSNDRARPNWGCLPSTDPTNIGPWTNMWVWQTFDFWQTRNPPKVPTCAQSAHQFCGHLRDLDHSNCEISAGVAFVVTAPFIGVVPAIGIAGGAGVACLAVKELNYRWCLSRYCS